MASSVKKDKSRIRIISGINIDMVLMVEIGTRAGMSHAIRHYAKGNTKYMKDYDKNKESSYLKYWDVNNIYGWVMSQKLPVNNFEKEFLNLMKAS